MAKSIQERVRATLAKQAADAKRATDKVQDAAFKRAERMDIAAEKRLDGLLAGTIEPRNLREYAIASGELDLLS